MLLTLALAHDNRCASDVCSVCQALAASAAQGCSLVTCLGPQSPLASASRWPQKEVAPSLVPASVQGARPWLLLLRSCWS